MSNRNILVTGASGFIGQRFISYNKGNFNTKPVSLRTTSIKNIELGQIDVILHLAGQAHAMKKIDPQIYFDVNYELTKELADAAKASGVKQFLFISTIKVYGENVKSVLNENSPCLPLNDPYGESKLKAEEYLQSISDESFKVAIVRPPLVYGPAVKGNLIRFLKLGDSGWYLPFANIRNRRTMVFVDNLIEVINRIIDVKGSGIFLAGDQEPISTTRLIQEIRKGLGKPPNLFTMPFILKDILKNLRPELVIRLFDSLEMDTSSTNKRLNFVPPFSIEEGIQSMVDDYLSKK